MDCGVSSISPPHAGRAATPTAVGSAEPSYGREIQLAHAHAGRRARGRLAMDLLPPLPSQYPDLPDAFRSRPLVRSVVNNLPLPSIRGVGESSVTKRGDCWVTADRLPET